MKASYKDFTAIYNEDGKPYKVYVYKNGKPYQTLGRVNQPTQASLEEIVKDYGDNA